MSKEENNVPSLILGLMNRDTGEVVEVELGNLSQQLALMAIDDPECRDAVFTHCLDTMAMVGAHAAVQSPEEERAGGIDITAKLAAKALALKIANFEDLVDDPGFKAALAEVSEAHKCQCGECGKHEEEDSPVLH